MSLYKTFLLLSRRRHPCKLPLPTMTFSPGTKKHPVPPPLLPTQWPWSWKQKGEVWPGWSLSLPPSPPLAQPSEGYHAQKAPSPRLCLGKAERKVHHSAQLELGAVLARLRPHPPSLLQRVTQKPWPDSTLTYFDVYTNQLFSESTCAEPYCGFMFLFKREVYLAIIINK